MQVTRNFIDNQFADAASGAHLDNVEPAVGAVYGTVPDSDERDVDHAVAAARAAWPGWAATPAGERSRLLLRVAELIDEHRARLARAESIDTGKPLRLARTVDIPRASANLRFFATAILHTRGDVHFMDGRAMNYTRRDPLGPVGVISPWNLPLYLLTWKVAPALATGNTVVAKPSELTPVTAHLLAELCVEAGLPPGVLNIVHGSGAKAGAALVAHNDVQAVSFTGGTATGRLIAAAIAPRFTKLGLEMGGKNPTVVFADADLDAALDGSVRAAFTNQGQVCLCGSRLFVERSIHDAFLERFAERTAALRVGDPLEETTEQGALVSSAHLEKVRSYVALARDEGGTIVSGGEAPDDLPARCASGFFLEPTVVAGLDARCRTNQEEIFGPVVSVMPFDDEDDVVEMANGTPYGLAASVWTRDVDRAHRVAGRLEAGTVWINCWLLRDLRVPFGGVKQSGVGREGGDEALRFFTEPKNVCVGFTEQPSSDQTDETNASATQRATVPEAPRKEPI